MLKYNIYIWGMDKLRVAIADDHQLAIEGYKVVLLIDEVDIVAEFNRGDDLVKWAVNNPNGADILLLDIQMPGLDGIEVLKHFRLHNVRMKTIIISAFSTQKYVEDVAKLGCRGFLLKSTCHLEFIEAIDAVMNDGFYYSKDLKKVELNEEFIINDLSKKEKELLPMLEEFSYKEISEHTSLSENTIKTYVRRIKEKLGVETKVGIIKWFHNKK
ncbi:putative DNA-binding response regulator [Tenacibaculum sp. 190524A02b]|uniref:DNA-binding response regulator n=1 Tax=Tenacibaculum vairaonense TaxID=3137860 RepID=A0ABM9PLV9_9FLAO